MDKVELRVKEKISCWSFCSRNAATISPGPSQLDSTPTPEKPSRRVGSRNHAHRGGGSPTTMPGDRARFRTTSLSVQRVRTGATESVEGCLRHRAAQLPNR